MKKFLGFFSKRERFNESARITEIINKKNITTIGPSYVVIDITNRCNLNCIACWSYSPLLNDCKPKPKWFTHEIKIDKLREVIKDLSKMGTERIRLSGGGDPFMHPHIMDIAREIKKKNITLEIVTNFTLVDESKIRELVNIGIDNLTVSLWAASPKTYKATHPNQKLETFDKINASLLKFNQLKKKSKTVIVNVISNLNYFEAEKMVDHAKEIDADETYFTLVDPIKNGTESLILSDKQVKDLREIWIKVISNFEKGNYGKLKIDNPYNLLRRLKNEGCSKGEYDAQVGNIPCTVGYTFSRILANGDVSPCCKAVMIPSGNINDNPFKEIWNGPRQRKFRKIGLEISRHPAFMEKVGCRRSCDNFMENIEMNDKISSYVNSQKGFK
ncbi:MAG: radical SAM protein [archaeon]